MEKEDPASMRIANNTLGPMVSMLLTVSGSSAHKHLGHLQLVRRRSQLLVRLNVQVKGGALGVIKLDSVDADSERQGGSPCNVCITSD